MLKLEVELSMMSVTLQVVFGLRVVRGGWSLRPFSSNPVPRTSVIGL